ncbi:amino acid ABC transporter permease [Suicoccus acidiformans]|uniref:Amino acid ABC transporter permease n=1 Tax=Suicoccus acidiformans TaxID=2036206 RepID=A0A347WKP2_9LACT|nr:amino acid ABC transporter permease [Suicoccus acidiformans]AXY25649.1 amino acid ABC transporter permease [Suicoccus acidiformans]
MEDLRLITDVNVLRRILDGLLIALEISAISLVIGVALGSVIGVLRTLNHRRIDILARIHLELVRILPLLVLLYVFYYTLPQVSEVLLSNEQVSIVVFVLWVSAETGDLVRTSIENVPRRQIESARALGMNRALIYREILIPQAIAGVIPPLVNLATRVIKTTSILLMIGVDEMIRIGQQIIENYTLEFPTASLWIYGLIMVLYFILCYPLSAFARYLERRYTYQKGGSAT